MEELYVHARLTRNDNDTSRSSAHWARGVILKLAGWLVKFTMCRGLAQRTPLKAHLIGLVLALCSGVNFTCCAKS